MTAHKCLENAPDEYEAEGPFEVRPKWPDSTDDDDEWEVARPTTTRGKRSFIYPGEICTCRDRALAVAVRDALNAFTAPKA